MIQRFMQWRLNGLFSLLLFLIAVPLFVENPFFFDMATQIALIGATVVGLNLLVGFAGQISLGHAGFFGLGAYFSAITTGAYGWPPLLAMLVAAVLVGLLAYVIGRPILRLKGHYLSMATLAVGFIIAIIINNERQLTGGPDGMPVEPFSIMGWELSVFATYSIFGIEIGGAQAWYLFAATVLFFSVLVAQNIIDSPVGRALKSIHGSEVAAQVTGINTARYKSRVFVVSALYASIMGSLFAHFSGFITPNMAGFNQSIIFITMVVLGGMGSHLGVIIGAAVITLLPQFLAGFREYETMMFGLILMLTMIFMPKGLLPTILNLVKSRLKKNGGEA